MSPEQAVRAAGRGPVPGVAPADVRHDRVHAIGLSSRPSCLALSARRRHMVQHPLNMEVSQVGPQVLLTDLVRPRRPQNALLRSPDPAGPSQTQRAGPGWLLAAAGVAGELLITAGVLMLLFAGYELKVTDYRAAGAQHRLQQQLTRMWAAAPSPQRGGGRRPSGITSPPAVRDGQGFAVIGIPRFGLSYHRVVVEGVSTADLQLGPGHYPGTALPGQVGNTVISGHRTTYGHPFWDADTLRPGDAIDLQVRDRIYRYRVTASHTVDPGDVAVTDPVPDNPTATATRRLLTLTTCTPRFTAVRRLIITAELNPHDVLPAAPGAG